MDPMTRRPQSSHSRKVSRPAVHTSSQADRVYCSNCGSPMSRQALVCARCGSPSNRPVRNRQQLRPVEEPQQRRSQTERPEYADFGSRLAAYLIDLLAVGIPYVIIYIILIAIAGAISTHLLTSSLSSPGYSSAVAGAALGLTFWVMLILDILSPIVFVFYWAIMESSPWQATLGKRVLGLVVTDMYGDRLIFGQSMKRAWGKLLSIIIFYVGFFLMLGSPHRQTMHDSMASTVVLKGRRPDDSVNN